MKGVERRVYGMLEEAARTWGRLGLLLTGAGVEERMFWG